MPKSEFLNDCLREFEKMRRNADGALAQVSEQDLYRKLDPGTNSLAEIMKHLAGNIRSRWTDFLTTDGDKPDRDRDAEFIANDADTPQRLRKDLADSWEFLSAELGKLGVADLDRTITIRGEPHTVRRSVLRQLNHHAGHVGQMVMLAKHFVGENWTTLSVPRGKSREYNQMMQEKFAAERK
ncbi:MAG: DUF1572 domain-containing protein [Acidobacteria bacterium]|nr:DUF1572 domain-containing protein [Acidobacteriota bacterium]